MPTLLPVLHLRRASAAHLAAVLLATGALTALLVGRWFDGPALLAVQRHTGGWIDQNLVLFSALNATIVGGLLLAWGRLRPSDLGLPPRALGHALALAVGAWTAVQALAVLAALAAGQSLTWHAGWTVHGIGRVLGFALAMLLGTALFEELVFRGYLLPQLFVRLPQALGRRWRMALAVLLSSLLFSSWHLPTLLIHQQLAGEALAAQLGSLGVAGTLLCLLYLRTGNLALPIVCHALVNAPTLVVASPVPGSTLAVGVGVAAIVLGPRLVGRPWSLALMRFEAVR